MANPIGQNIPNMPSSIPQVNPGIPTVTPTQGMPLGCGACGQTQLGSAFARAPLWAKVLVPVGIIGVGIAIAVAISRRPQVPLYEEIEEEVDF